jgi:hypothetical protein
MMKFKEMDKSIVKKKKAYTNNQLDKLIHETGKLCNLCNKLTFWLFYWDQFINSQRIIQVEEDLSGEEALCNKPICGCHVGWNPSQGISLVEEDSPRSYALCDIPTVWRLPCKVQTLELLELRKVLSGREGWEALCKR